MQDGVVSVDDAMMITHANEAIEHFFLFPPDQLTGKTIRDVVRPSFSSCIEVLEKTIQTREPVREFRTEVAGKDGRQMIAVINCSPLIDRDGTFMGSVLVLRDISRITTLERELQERQSFLKIVGKSAIMQDIYTRIEALAETDTTVLITGGSGTGKELVAEAIHYSGSRALKPLVKFNCTAFAENLLESELFGHVAGAFTGAIKDKIGRFQMAHEGTIFLDEIGDMAPALQLKLLRVLQEHEFERVGDTRPIKVDIRVIAATNCDLLEKMRRGAFREDLYYRLNVMEMNLPALAQRIEDIPLLVSHFCAKFSKKLKKDVKGVSDQVMRLFVNYQWPGNVRELENVMERAFILCSSDTITTDHISLQLKDDSGLENGIEESECALDHDQILNALKQTRWNRSKAAELLGISRRTFYRKLKDLHLLEDK